MMSSRSGRPTLLLGGEALRVAERIWPCYDEVFGDHANYGTWREDMFDRHVARDGFRLVFASDGGQVVGFGWGYVGQRGQYWSDLAWEALAAPVATTWIGGHFEVVELAVRSVHRSRGLGQALHDRLLDGVHRRCLLSTSADEDDPAVRLYRRAGWTTLGALRAGVQVMGLDRTSRPS